MAYEIERKFLVADPEGFRPYVTESHILEQAYISRDKEATVRLRIIDGREARLTVKSLTRGAVRHEWEYPIPVADAREMLETLPVSALLTKTRHIAGRWEIDEFGGRHRGLILAEIELNSPDEPVEIPPFIGEEVTGDPRYYNSALAES
ncbi:MAG: CYTH domain-containing protein [Clostridium sp.]|nr:CYTH domain-containing protein [Clostridium sp.]